MTDPSFAIPVPPEVFEQFVGAVSARVLKELSDRDACGDGWPGRMSVETAARYLDVSEERVRKLKERRGIPHYQEGPGCRVFFRRSELDRWMEGYRTWRA